MRLLGFKASIATYAACVTLAFGGVTGVTGCVVNEAAPVREDRPAAPGPQAVWVGGYWHWTGIQYAWIPGHWDAPPPGATWSAPVYTARDGRYFYESGGWKPGDAQTRNALR
jgi:hypothetical protein